MIRKLLFTFSLIVVFCGPISVAAVSAQSSTSSPTQTFAAAGQSDACDALTQLDGTKCTQNGGNPQGKIDSLAKNVVEIISYVAGVAAIIMIVISGIKYTTSGGDSASVSSAKTTLVYALIGVAVAALAQFLVHFVLNRAG